jgi:hypothetical protein
MADVPTPEPPTTPQKPKFDKDDPSFKFRKTGYELLDNLPILDQMVGSGGQHFNTSIRGIVRQLFLDTNGDITGFKFAIQDTSGVVGKEIFIKIDPASPQGRGLLGRYAKVAYMTGWHTELTVSKQIYKGEGDYYASYVQNHNRDVPVKWYGKNNEGKLGVHQVKYGDLEDPLNTEQDKFQRVMADRMTSELFIKLAPELMSSDRTSKLKLGTKQIKGLMGAKFKMDDAAGDPMSLSLTDVFIRRLRASNLVSQADRQANGEGIYSLLPDYPEFVPYVYSRPEDTKRARLQHEERAREYAEEQNEADKKFRDKFEEYVGKDGEEPKKTFKEILGGKLSSALKDETGQVLKIQKVVLGANGLPELQADGTFKMKEIQVDRLTHNLHFDDDEQGFQELNSKLKTKIEDQIKAEEDPNKKKKMEGALKKLVSQTKSDGGKIENALRSERNAEQRMEYLMNRTVLEAFSTNVANISRTTFKTETHKFQKSIEENTTAEVQEQIDKLLRADPKIQGTLFGKDKDLVTLCDDMMIAQGILLPNTVRDDNPETPGKKYGSVANHTSHRLIKEAVDRALNEAQEYAVLEDIKDPDGRELSPAEKQNRKHEYIHHSGALPVSLSNAINETDKALDKLHKGPPGSLEEALARRIKVIDDEVAPNIISEINGYMDRIKFLNGIPRRGEMDPVSSQAAWAAFLEGLSHGTKGLKELLTELEAGYGLIDLTSK